MNKIDVIILNEATNNPAGMQLFLAKLTQRGHVVHNGKELLDLYNQCMDLTNVRSSKAIQALANMPHGTIKRFSPIIVAIVGASRRFLAQARTNQVGVDYVSASLQYSDYSGSTEDQFVVPYEITKLDAARDSALKVCAQGSYTYMSEIGLATYRKYYLSACNDAMEAYKEIALATDNDTAGYAAPQGLRNILIMQGNHQSWDYFIRLRTCNRNTLETQYVALRIWEELLLHSANGTDLFAMSGADCVHGKCREGKMSCKQLLYDTVVSDTKLQLSCSLPTAILRTKFPLLYQEV